MSGYITPLPLPARPGAALPRPRAVAVMGSTGSIGVNALAFMALHREAFQVVALAGARNIPLLAEQAAFWRPAVLAVLDAGGAAKLREALRETPGASRLSGYTPEILYGPEGYAALAALPQADIILSAQVGAAGLIATDAAARAGKTIALANKESMVLAGNLLRDACRRTGALILPVDSEHSAIFQCLEGRDYSDISRIILTASGGPFRGKDAAFLRTVTPEMALAHPNWSMGAKISIDSATMMNKGLEVIEAHYLYGLPVSAIDVLIHPQSIVHSLVEFIDGSQLAQTGTPDMRIAIGYALAWPRRMETGVPRLDLAAAGPLTFDTPDLSLFPGLALAIRALSEGGGQPVVYNAANEVAVERFLKREIAFTDIAKLVEAAMDAHARNSPYSAAPATLDDILALDGMTRQRMTA